MPENERLLDIPKFQKYETSPLSHSPLRPPSEDEENFFGKQEPTKSTGYLILLTLCIGGLQIAWSVELAYLSPFLLSLGLSKAVLALVWIAGPLSGTLVQPYVGMRSDNSRMKWGRRRPFIVGGAVATMVSLLFLAWCKEVMGGIMSIFGQAADSAPTLRAIQLFAVLFVYILDFAINVVQAAIRAFIVDCAPSHQQSDANAWASRITGLGNILGYLSGYVELPPYIPFFGNTQFKDLAALTCIIMISTISISVLSVQERDPRTLGEPNKDSAGLVGFFVSLYQAVQRLPLQISLICQVQLAAWIGWFPFLFYITTYVAEIYADPYFEANSNLTDEQIDKIMEDGTRMGTLALFVFALTTFTSSVFLPFIIAPSYTPFELPPSTPLTPAATTTPRYQEGAQTASGDYFFHKPVLTRRRTWRTRWRRRLSPSRLQIKWLTLRRAWMLSHLVFTLLMWCTFFVRDVRAATVLVGAIGVPWALTNWAPFALISAEISKRDAIRRGERPPPPTLEGRRLAAGEDPVTGGDEGGQAGDQAGVVLGIHNVAIAAPQVVATLISSVIFQKLQKPRGFPGDNSVAWVLRFGGLCAIVAAWATTRVGEGNDEDEDVYDR